MSVERFERALADNDFPSSVSPRVAAKYINALAEGIAVEAASGARGTTLLT